MVVRVSGPLDKSLQGFLSSLLMQCWQFLTAKRLLWLAGYPDGQGRQMLLEEESPLCVSVQSTVVQQSSGSEQDSDVVAQCELFPDSSCLWPNVAKIQRATEAASLASNPSSLCFCGQRS